MLPSLIKIGITTFLKTLCKKIKIKNIEIKFSDKNQIANIEKLIIEAEKIVYRNLYINKLKLVSSDLSIGFKNRTKSLSVENFNMNFFLILDSQNLSNILFSKSSKELRYKIENFTTEKTSIHKINIIDKSININYIKDDRILEKFLGLLIKDNELFLKDISNNNILKIPIDPNIRFNSVFIDEEELTLIFNSKVTI